MPSRSFQIASLLTSDLPALLTAPSLARQVYREFVTGFGLEFYPIGGDPKVLSEFVVKHR